MTVDVIFTIFDANKLDEPNVEQLRFTNIPMERVKAAIDLLNDEHPSILETPIRAGVGEFTKEELFPHSEDSDYFVTCQECGSMVLPTFRVKHTSWHNKLLP